jgi:elongation factor Ts
LKQKLTLLLLLKKQKKKLQKQTNNYSNYIKVLSMKITAADVNKLRKQTGAGMMDCKKALVEAEGDFESAVDYLRKQGQKIAAKREDRDATEGVILSQASADGTSGAVIVLNCETDFVAKNEDYVALANKFLSIALENKPASLEALKALAFDGEFSIAEKIVQQTGVIGEKLDLSAYAVVEAACVVPYIHPGNRLATLVAFNKGGDAVVDAGRQVAMQVAAMAPIALDKSGVSDEAIARELEVGKELAIQEGKPAEMADKIAQGRLGKFFKENTLLSQPFVRDNKQTVEQFLNGAESGLTVTEFKRLALS